MEEQIKDLFIIIIAIFLFFFNANSIFETKLVDVEIEKELPKNFIKPEPYFQIEKKEIEKSQIPSRVTSNTIYLTFDDGPTYLTEEIVNILKEENVPATFFVIGTQIDQYKNVVKKAYDDGHTIAIHTYTHKYDEVYASDENYFNDLKKINNKIYEITGHHSYIVRLPGGSSNIVSKKYNSGVVSRITDKLVKDNYYYFDWNVDSGDASGTLTKEQIYENATKNLHYGTNIILMHDAATKKTTVEALRNIIKYGKTNNYTFARITKETPAIRHHVNN